MAPGDVCFCVRKAGQERGGDRGSSGSVSEAGGGCGLPCALLSVDILLLTQSLAQSSILCEALSSQLQGFLPSSDSCSCGWSLCVAWTT